MNLTKGDKVLYTVKNHGYQTGSTPKIRTYSYYGTVVKVHKSQVVLDLVNQTNGKTYRKAACPISCVKKIDV